MTPCCERTPVLRSAFCVLRSAFCVLRSAFCVLLLLLFANINSASAQPQPPQYFAGTGHWYQLVVAQSPVDWPSAKDSAITMGGYLVSILSVEENEFVKAVVSDPPFVQAFTGGYEQSGEGDWQWVSGEPWGYTNWNAGEPNNGCPSNCGEESITLIHGPALGALYGTWNDGIPTNIPAGPYGFVVEFVSSPCGQTHSPQYYPGTGHWYQFFDMGTCNPICWTAGRDSAIAYGGYLATITSAEESTFVMNSLTPAGRSGDAVWLGGTDFASEGNWEWVTGETWSFAPWGPGEPDNLGGAQNYLYWWAPVGRFHDNDECLGVTCFIVEYNTVCSDIPCPFDAADTNCDGAVDILDVVGAVNVAFRGGAPLTPCCELDLPD